MLETVLSIIPTYLTTSWVIVPIILLLTFYKYNTWEFDRFEKQGIPYIKPVPLYGTIKEYARGQTSFSGIQESMYFKLKDHRVGGLFYGRRPMLMIRDPDLIRIVTVRDFDHFTDKHLSAMSPKAVGAKGVIFLQGAEWKRVRNATTPIFTSGKIKLMSNLISECVQDMVNYLDMHHASEELELKNFFGRYTMDVITSCAFAFPSNAIHNPHSEIFKLCSNFTNNTLIDRLLTFITIDLLDSYKLATFLHADAYDLKFQIYLKDLVIQSMENKQRIENDAMAKGKASKKRIDILQMLLDARAGILKATADKDDDDLFGRDSHMKEIYPQSLASVFTDDTIIGTAIVLLIAAFETTSTVLTFIAYELAQNHDVQNRLRKEVRDVLQRHDGKLDYNSVFEMPYLEMVINETLRKHPPISRIERYCTTSSYQVPGTKAFLRKGDMIVIPVRGIHHDPKYYPNPDQFDPERFTPENKQTRSPYAFLPFGHGPRNCIGMRFSTLNTKMAIVGLINKFKFDICELTEIPYEICRISPFLKARNGIYLNITKADDNEMNE